MSNLLQVLLTSRGAAVGIQLPGTIKRIDLGLLASAALTLPNLIPVLPEGIPHTHDGFDQLIQVLELERVVKTGVVYPRWAPDFALGYGMPLFNYYPPLSHYIALLLRFLGLGYTTAIELTFYLSILFSAITMYLFVKDLWGSHAGILSAAVYTYFPYHMVDIYVRGAMAESWAYVFFPLLLWSFLLVHRKPSTVNLALGGLSFALLLLAHNGMALIFAPVVGMFVILLLCLQPPTSRKELVITMGRSSLSILLGLGLSAFFWLPFLAESRYVQIDRITSLVPYSEHFVYPFQLFSNFWGHGGSEPGPNDGMAFQLGIIPLSLTIIAIIAEIVLGSSKKLRLTLLFFLTIAILATIMTLDWSEPIWRLLPFLAPLPFPWRFLTISGFAMAVIAGCILFSDRFSRTTLNYAAGCLVLLIIVYSYRFIDVESNRMYDKDFTIHLIAEVEKNVKTFGFTTAGEYLPLWATKPEDSPMYESLLNDKTPIKVRSLSPNGATANALQHSADSDEFGVSFPAAGKLEINTYYFPGWRAEIDGKPYDPDPSEFLTVNVPAGNHIIKVSFTDTPVRTLGNSLSILSFLFLLILLLPARYRAVIALWRADRAKTAPRPQSGY